MVCLGKVGSTGSISLSTSFFQRADRQQKQFQKLFVFWHSPISQQKSRIRTTTNVHSLTQSVQKQLNFPAYIFFNLQTKPLEDIYRNFTKTTNISARTTSTEYAVFRTAVNAFFNNGHHQSQVRHNCRYGRVHNFKVRVLLRKRLNTTFPMKSSAAEARTSISAISKATTEKKRTRRDNEERLQTDFNCNRSTTNFLIFCAQKWGRCVPGGTF